VGTFLPLVIVIIQARRRYELGPQNDSRNREAANSLPWRIIAVEIHQPEGERTVKAKNNRLKSIVVVVAISSLAIGSGFMIAAPVPPQNETKKHEAAPAAAIPLKLGRSVPLRIQSSGVEWGGSTFHLVSLGSIQFALDKQTSRLKADIKAGVTEFDDVDYDVSAAVFDATGKLLGAARSRCGVQRVWAGTVFATSRTINLDFGVSLDYGQAASFMVSISKRKVLTPSDWQK
jgi:hypothetical protein